MSGGRLGPCAILAGGIVLAAAHAAAADGEPIRIDYHAPEGCPDEAAFFGQVMARTTRPHIAAPGESARTFKVTIAAGAKVRGKLVIEDPKGPPSVREVSGATCEEVVSAIGLVTALAIDPHASAAPTVHAAPLPPVAPPAPPPTPPKPREKLPPPPRFDTLPWWGPIGAPLPVVIVPEPEIAARWRWGWGVHFGAASAIAPGVVPVMDGFVEIAREGSWLSPAFRLAIARADSGFIATPGKSDSASFRLLAARLEGCPLRLDLLPTLTARPCVSFEAGALDAAGVAAAMSVPSVIRPWAAPGVGARVALTILDRVVVELEGGAMFPLVRDEYFFAPSTIAHQVPAAGAFVSGGVGTHFP